MCSSVHERIIQSALLHGPSLVEVRSMFEAGLSLVARQQKLGGTAWNFIHYSSLFLGMFMNCYNLYSIRVFPEHVY